jgi:hypothetical protein
MTTKKRGSSSFDKVLEEFLSKNSDLKAITQPEKLEYYRQDLNVDLPPLIRDLLLKSKPDLVLQPTSEDQISRIFALARNRIP